MEEKNMNSPKLLLSFIVDNSASMTGERLGELMSYFRNTPITGAEFELLTFYGFQPTVVKSFDDSVIAPVKAGGFPLLSRAVSLATERLGARVSALRASGADAYRPWLFILSDGFTLDVMEETAASLETLESNGDVLCLPFQLSGNGICDRMQSLDRSKHMVQINEGCIGDFFAFVTRMIERRAALPLDEGVKFTKSDL